jgi:hypothetical protein
MMGTEMFPSQSPIYHLQITEFLSAADFGCFEDQEDRVDEDTKDRSEDDGRDTAREEERNVEGKDAVR